MAFYVGNQKVCPIIKENIDWSKNNYTNSINLLPIPCIDNGYLTNFTNNTAAYCPKTNINNNYTDCVDFSQPFEISVEFVPPTTAGGAVFGNAFSDRYFCSPSFEIQNTENSSIWTGVSTNGSSWTNNYRWTRAEMPILQQKHYIVKHIWDGTDYTVSVQYDNVIVSDTQTLSANPYYSTNTNSYQTAFGFGGTALASRLSYKDGKIYLPNTYIKQNGVLVWGNEGKYVNHIGYNFIPSSVTLTNNNGVISGFSNTAYATIGTFSPQSYPWEFVIGFKTGSNTNVSTSEVLTGMFTDKGLLIYYKNGYLETAMSSDGSNWTIGDDVIIMPVSANTTYRIKAEYTGSVYNYYKWENNDWALIKTISDSNPVYSGLQQIFGNLRGDGHILTGSINLNECYININGSRWWTGAV